MLLCPFYHRSCCQALKVKTKTKAKTLTLKAKDFQFLQGEGQGQIFFKAKTFIQGQGQGHRICNLQKIKTGNARPSFLLSANAKNVNKASRAHSHTNFMGLQQTHNVGL